MASALSTALVFHVVVICVGFVLALAELVLGVFGSKLGAVACLTVRPIC